MPYENKVPKAGTDTPRSSASAARRAGARGGVDDSPRVVAQLARVNRLFGEPKRPAGAAGLVAQCVGGHKFGLEAQGSQDDEDVQRGIALLKEALAGYKAEVKARKELAAQDFNGGDRADLVRQQTYTTALRDAEMTSGGLVARLGPDFAHAVGVISFRGKAVARIHEGNLAYVQSAAAISPAHSAVYKRHTLDGPSERDYVSLGGAFVRREAYRGITPPERAAYQAGDDLTPMNDGRHTTGETGYSFNEATGAPIPRQHDPDNDKPNDLEWLARHADRALGAVPDDPRLLAFLQTRKGVGKAFSATSTPKAITSNHGTAFTGFGNITIDLAQVPVANVTHHYKAAPFTTGGVSAAIGGRGTHHHLDWETDRANESVTRNREIVLSSIPNAAVTGLADTPQRVAYENEFRRRYLADYQQRHAGFLSDAGLPPAVAPVPAVIPYVEDHFTAAQAVSDSALIYSRARSAAWADVQLRVAYRDAYLVSYAKAWTQGYEEEAYDLVADDQWQNQHRVGYDHVPLVPEAPAPDPAAIPAGNGAAAGTLQGHADGDAAGRIAGRGYVPG